MPQTTIAPKAVEHFNNLAQLIHEYQVAGKPIQLAKLVKDPRFVLPCKADYVVKMSVQQEGVPAMMYSGKDSYIDWCKTVTSGSLVLGGLSAA